METKNKKKKIIIMLIVYSILIIVLFLPSIRLFINQSINKDFIATVEKHALSANIKIVQLNSKIQGGNTSTSVSAGASGVIFNREGQTYYALTAKHVVSNLEETDQTQHFAMNFQQLDFKDYIDNGGEFQGIIEYYLQFPLATVEYSSNKYDLAIISFTSDKEYAVLPISAKTPQHGDKVASMSNPYGKRNIVTAGKVISRKPKPFGDQAGTLQYPIIRHNAMLSEGSSGSALLNENLEIVGINLGGGENIIRKFVYGMAMPSDRILNFLSEYNEI